MGGARMKHQQKPEAGQGLGAAPGAGGGFPRLPRERKGLLVSWGQVAWHFTQSWEAAGAQVSEP